MLLFTAPGFARRAFVAAAVLLAAALVVWWRVPRSQVAAALPGVLRAPQFSVGAASVPAAARPDPAAPLPTFQPRQEIEQILASPEHTQITFTLPDGTAVAGIVNAVREDLGTRRVGGTLGDGRTFMLSSREGHVSGLLQIPRQRLAFTISEAADGQLALQPRPLGQVICLPDAMPRLRASTVPAAKAPPAVPVLSSRPEATAVLYLDLDGELIHDPAWYGGEPFQAEAFDLSEAGVREIWGRVAESYVAFNIDITTDVERYRQAPVGMRMRCIITPTNFYSSNVAGVAYNGSFHQSGGPIFSSDICCFAFNTDMEPMVHELGHTFGLSHDGLKPNDEYYGGFEDRTGGWAPIMGASFGRAKIHWSNGYLGATNLEDDLAIITSAENGFGYVQDEAGGTLATAAPLVLEGEQSRSRGVIANQNDADVYRFEALEGDLDLTVNTAPEVQRPGLDLEIELFNADGVSLLTALPQETLNASLHTTLEAGTYFLRVKGGGSTDPEYLRYSAYGSIGTYSIDGIIPRGFPRFTGSGPQRAVLYAGRPSRFPVPTRSREDVLTLASGSLPRGLFIDSAGQAIRGTAEEEGEFQVSILATNEHGSSPLSVSILVKPFILPLSDAVDQPDLRWISNSLSPWVAQSAVVHDGVDAAAATALPAGRSATMETTLSGPVSLRFLWKVAGEAQRDFLLFAIDGVEQLRATGQTAWQTGAFPIPSGSHRLTFTLRQGSAGADGTVGGWIDEMKIIRDSPSVTGPTGSDRFADAQALLGTNVALTSFNATATSEEGEPAELGGTFGRSLWWTWTAPATGMVHVRAESDSRLALGVYLGTTLADLHPAPGRKALKSAAAELKFPAQAGLTYYLAVAQEQGAGRVNLSLDYTGDRPYLGVVQPPAEGRLMAGFIRITPTPQHAYSAQLLFAGRRYSFLGNFFSGSDEKVLKATGQLDLQVRLLFRVAGGDLEFTGTVTENNQVHTFRAARALDPADLPKRARGSYTLVLEPATSGSFVSYGAGYGRATVAAKATIRYVGTLGDGRKVAQGGSLTVGGGWPLYLAPYGKTGGALSGRLAFDGTVEAAIAGNLLWRVPDTSDSVKIDEQVKATGERFHPLQRGEYPLGISAGMGSSLLHFTHRDESLQPPDAVLTLEPRPPGTGSAERASIPPK